MTDVRRTQQQLKARAEEKHKVGREARIDARSKHRAGAPAGSGAYREDYAEDHGPDSDEATDVTESGREFPGSGDAS